jgi:hypothetical protein
VTTSRPYTYRSGGGQEAGRTEDGHDAGAMLGAVRDDIRQTLRTAWTDPSIDACTAYPAFFTAAWSAVRPNVGKTFLALARTVRAEGADSVRSGFAPTAIAARLRDAHSDEEVHRIEESARSAFLAVPKVQVVIHAFHRMLRRERIPGTGREESPVRRGVPEWQRWMAFQPNTDGAEPLLAEATDALGAPAAPGVMRLFARWPAALSAIWADAEPWVGTEAWRNAASKARRAVLAGVSGLPHPMEIQWGAMKARGFSDAERLGLLDVVAAFDQAMAGQTVMAAFAWVALGAPEVGTEG